MKYRVAIAAALLTVLASSCDNKVWIDCPTTTVLRTKNKALNWKVAPSTTIYEAKGSQC